MTQFAKALIKLGQLHPPSAEFDVDKLIHFGETVSCGFIDRRKDIQKDFNAQLLSSLEMGGRASCDGATLEASKRKYYYFVLNYV